MGWIYSVVVDTKKGASVMEAPAGGWTQNSAIQWARVDAHRALGPGAKVEIYRARGRTGRATQLRYRAYILGSDGITHRTDNVR